MLDFIKQLGIDPILLVGQMVNFLILAYILHRLLYQPVLKLLNDRKAMIADGIENAKRAEIALISAQQEKDKLIKEARTEARLIISQTQEMAQKQSTRAENELTQKLVNLKAKAKEQIRRDKAVMFAEVESEILDLVIAVNKRLLGTALSDDIYRKTLNNSIKILQK